VAKASRLCADCPSIIPGTSRRCALCKRSSEAKRGTPEQRGYGPAWRRLRLVILERDGHSCRWCGGPANTVDHVTPKAHGGSDDPSNLVAACLRCNSSRGGRTSVVL